MIFTSPIRLLLLAAPVGLAIAYVWLQRRRRAVTVRFTDVDLLASVAPRRPGWQRHVAPVLLLATLVLLVVGFARPARRVRTPRRQATVVLAVDVSGSMVASDVDPDRLTAAKEAAGAFLDSLPPGVRLGLVSFSTGARIEVAPTTDRASVRSALDGLEAGGGTATGEAIQLALQSAAAIGGGTSKVPAAVVLMSDGKPTEAAGAAAAARAVDEAVAAAEDAGVKVSTIAFGTDAGVVTVQGETIAVPSDPAAMAAIASATGGQTFTAASAGQLRSVYDDIGRTVGYVTRRLEVTALFTGLGLLAAALAAVAALVWGHRIA